MTCTSSMLGQCRKCPLGKTAGRTVNLLTPDRLPTKTVHITEKRPGGRISYIGFADHGCFVGWADPEEYIETQQQTLSGIA